MTKKIGLIAAMPEEVKPLIRQVGTVRREELAGFPFYRFTFAGKDACLIESGIGAARAARAALALVDAMAPDLVINFGFAGAVLAGPAVGDIVVADRLRFFRERLFREQPGLSPELTAKLAAMLEQRCQGRSFSIHRGTFITAGEIVGKRMVAGLLPAGTATPVLEMESAAVARVAYDRNVQLTAIRGISDGADEELDFSIADFTDEEMRIRIWKVLRTLARKPRIIPQLMRLEKNSRIAGENLATAVLAIIEGL
ncbi:MAG: 5'-methylthioadenosine/S-adenosylhomocysteine nucleosidase [Geobacteraceae bacterium]|nr:5'-methylthioadenosine/S-adenosylhomocysteine nucleosidase [Geobacteraceae bacterium]